VTFGIPKTKADAAVALIRCLLVISKGFLSMDERSALLNGFPMQITTKALRVAR
jgi:hypothetical protein